MTIFKKLNGWKMVLGIALIGIGAAVEVIEPTTGAIIKEAGKMLTEVGALHKAIKAASAAVE